MTCITQISYAEGAGPRHSPGLSLYLPGKLANGFPKRILVQLRDSYVDPDGRVIDHAGHEHFWIWRPSSTTVWMTLPTQEAAIRAIESLLEEE